MNRLITACVLICLSTLSWATKAEGVVKERMDRFKDNKAAMKAIKGNLGGDAAVIAQKASEIEAWAHEMVTFFPEGSSQPPSEALPAIWEAFDHFTELANANATAAANLKTLAQSGAIQTRSPMDLRRLGKPARIVTTTTKSR